MKLTNQLSHFQPIPLQQEAIDLVKSTNATNLLFYGGGRSGKSIVICYIILMRALAASGSRHGIFRREGKAAKDTLFKVAWEKMIDLAYPGMKSNPKACSINKEDMTYEFSNGSIIAFFGFDDNNRDRILGQEFNTIWMNECSEFEYDDYETLSTRLSGVTAKDSGSGNLKPLMMLDLNPDLDTHFTYKLWVQGLDPSRNVPLDDPADYASLQMNLLEDASHIDAGYLKRAKQRSDEKVQRFVKGYWRSEREYSMFKPSIVNAHRVPVTASASIEERLAAIPELVRIGVNVDPAVSSHEKSDEHGITVTGIDEAGMLYVLADYSLKGSPTDWANAVVAAYKDWRADFIVIEKNQGGDLVKEPLRHINPHLPIRLVHASRGKVIRAEPVSVLYADGMVKHVGEFPTLERQMYAFHSSFDRKKSGSPDRLDSLVWGITALTEDTGPPKTGRSSTSVGMF